MADELQQRDADDMRAINAKRAPRELHPIVEAIINVDAAWRHKREVTAFAAHELRTPLVGLKTQAQIALSASDSATKGDALRQILFSVDRTSRLVRQLLAIAKLDAGSETDRRENLIAGQLITILEKTKSNDLTRQRDSTDRLIILELTMIAEP